MTSNQIRFAKQHDWYVDQSADNDAVLVKDVSLQNEVYEVELLWFDDFQELKIWAGY